MAGALSETDKQEIIDEVLSSIQIDSSILRPVEMTVTNSDGKTVTGTKPAEKDLTGTFSYVSQTVGGKTVNNPYRFYAATAPNATGSGDNPTGKRVVAMVMPLGGDLSGLYRFPRVGEKVLVGTNGSNNYMMGYVPSNGSQFEETPAEADFLAGQGEVFRYKQTGKKPQDAGPEKYSEIGFYHKPTKWNASSDTKTQYDDVPTKDAKDLPPLIDLVNIHSTGDIHESAVNHHQIQAKRLELAANGDGNDVPEFMPDASKFKPGDIHIKAGQDITIEAGGSITLKVGRGSITISDKGVTITHQLMRHLSNLADASISLNAREGVTIAGETVGISADHDWSISEKMGSSVGGTAGALSLGGREITAEVPGWMSQLGANTAYLINAVQKVAVGGQALTTNSNTGKKTEALWTQLFTSTAKNFADLGFTFFKFKKLREKFQSYKTQADPKTAIEQAVKNVEEKGTARDKLAADADASAEDRAAAVDELDKAIRDLDNLTNAVLAVQDANRTALDVSPGMLFLGSANIPPFEKVAIVMNLVLSIANAAFKITEKIMEEKLKGDVLDRFNYASMVVTNGIILTATSIQLGLTAAAKEGGTAGLCLGFDGSIVARAARNQTFYAITEQKGAAPGPMIADWVFWFTAAATGATKLTNTSIAFTNALQALQKVDDTENPEVL